MSFISEPLGDDHDWSTAQPVQMDGAVGAVGAGPTGGAPQPQPQPQPQLGTGTITPPPLSPATATAAKFDLSDIPDAKQVHAGGFDLSDIPDATPQRDPRAVFGEQVEDAAAGAVIGATRTVQTLAKPIRKAFGMQPATPPPEAQGVAGKIGEVAEGIGEYMIPSTLATKVTKLLRVAPKLRAAGLTKLVAEFGRATVEAAMQAAGGAATAKIRGEDVGTAAAISGAAPFIGPVMEAAVPRLKAGARAATAKVLGTGVSPRVARAAETPKILDRAAGDALHQGINNSWAGWERSTLAAREAQGARLGATVRGPEGKVPLPTARVHAALDDVIDKASHMVPLDQAGDEMVGTALEQALKGQGPAPSGWIQKPLNPQLIRAARVLKRQLGDYMTAEDLHDLKSLWDKAVYGAKESQAMALPLRERLAAIDAQAKKVAADGLREVFQSGQTPNIAAADAAFARAAKLHQLVTKAAIASQKDGEILPKITQHAFKATVGAAVGGAEGYRRGGLPGSLLGAAIGATGTHMLDMAMRSPGWKLMGARAKEALADAIVNGDMDRVRQLLTPVIASQMATSRGTPAPAPSTPPQ